jgi:hypothetical protein
MSTLTDQVSLPETSRACPANLGATSAASARGGGGARALEQLLGGHDGENRQDADQVSTIAISTRVKPDEPTRRRRR